MIDRDFILAQGRWVIFTLNVPDSFQAAHPECKPHYTYRVNYREANGKYGEAYFLNLLAGPNNTADYSYLGMLNPATGAVKLTHKSRMSDKSWPVRLVRRIMAALWTGDGRAIQQAGFDLLHADRCGRCGRALTTPESIERGLGPVCVQSRC